MGIAELFAQAVASLPQAVRRRIGAGRPLDRGAPEDPGTGIAVAEAARGFLRDTRGGATAIVAAVVTVLTVGGTALLGDHLWLVDQRDTLKSASEAASVAATLEIDRQLAKNPEIAAAALEAAVAAVARRYVELNLAHLPEDRLRRAKETLKVTVSVNHAQRTVGMETEADLGGTLFSRHLPLLGSYTGPATARARAGVEAESPMVEVVLAIDVTSSMSRGLTEGRNPRPGESRIDIVKRAAKRIVAILDPDDKNSVGVGIVPWSWTVRLNSAAAREWERKRWARYPARRTYPVPFRCLHGRSCANNPVIDTLPASPPEPWKGCFDGQRIHSGTSSVPAPTATALFAPPSGSPFAQSYFPPRLSYSYRCRTDDEKPAGTDNPRCLQGGPAQNRCDTATMMPLSNDRTAIERSIDRLSTSGSTHSTLGVVWAQRMLEPAWTDVWGGIGINPANPATPESATRRKAIVLLTDGEDSFCGNPNPDCANSPLTVSRTDACAAAKSRGTEIFVVAAMHPSRISSSLGRTLRACSSESDSEFPEGSRRPGTSYVFLSNATAEDLEASFADIGNQLRNLRRVY